MSESEAPFPFHILTPPSVLRLRFLSARLRRGESPACFVAPRSCHVPVSSMAPELFASLGPGTGQRQQNKADGRELFGCGSPKKPKINTEIFGRVDSCVQSGL